MEDLHLQLRESRAAADRAREAAEHSRDQLELLEARCRDAVAEHQKTTLKEYLHYCHAHLYLSLPRVQRSSLAPGHAASVTGKYYPKFIRPWDADASIRLQNHIDGVERICGERRLFYSRDSIKDQARIIRRNEAGNENDIALFKKLAVENPVAEILSILEKEGILRRYFCSQRLRFATHDGQLEDQMETEDEESGQYRHHSKRIKTENTAATGRVKPEPAVQPDGFGLRTDHRGRLSRAFVYDFKAAAHEFPPESLDAVLRNENLFIEVADRKTSNAGQRRIRNREEELVKEKTAMALVQVYDYMIRYGVGYGYIAAGRWLVFLKIKGIDEQTIYYRLCSPPADPEAHIDEAGTLIQGAVTDLVGFCLQSLLCAPIEGLSLVAERQKAGRILKRWPDYNQNNSRLGAHTTIGSGELGVPSAPP